MRHRPLTQLALAVSVALGLAYAGCGSDSGGGGTAGGAGAGTGGAASGGAGTGATGNGGSGALNFGGAGNASDGGGNGGSAGDACASVVVNSTLVPANLLFVIDRSGSMTCNLPPDQSTPECDAYPAPKDPNKPTKWQLTKAALEQAIDDLSTAGNISAGLVVFPRPASDCSVTQTPDVAIQPLDTTQATLLKNFLGSVVPKGATPLAGATILSYAHLYDLLKAGTVKGNLFVVLLTDGYETCLPAEIGKLLGQDVPTAHQQLGIRTFVIGVPGSENGRALLSQIAWQGGTPKSTTCTHDPTPADKGDCHFDMTQSANFSQDLKNALAQISGSVLSCEIDVPPTPPGKKINPNSVKVDVSGNAIVQDSGKSCDQANGWQFSSDLKKIYLCGTACDEAKKPNATIELDLGCLGDIR